MDSLANLLNNEQVGSASVWVDKWLWTHLITCKQSYSCETNEVILLVNVYFWPLVKFA